MKPEKPSASRNNKAAKKHLKQLLRLVEQHPVRYVDYDAEADFAEVFSTRAWVEHLPTGKQTHTIKVVLSVAEVSD